MPHTAKPEYTPTLPAIASQKPCIQYMLDGVESILWAPQPSLKVTKPYEPDIEFYALTPDPVDVILSAGRFCVLLPEDAHAPCIAHGTPGKVRKAVVKVRL